MASNDNICRFDKLMKPHEVWVLRVRLCFEQRTKTLDIMPIFGRDLLLVLHWPIQSILRLYFIYILSLGKHGRIPTTIHWVLQCSSRFVVIFVTTLSRHVAVRNTIGQASRVTLTSSSRTILAMPPPQLCEEKRIIRGATRARAVESRRESKGVKRTVIRTIE